MMKNYITNAYNGLPISIITGCGIYLTDERGVTYLDFSAGIATVSLGHCQKHITDKLIMQATRLYHSSNLFRIPEQERLAKRLCDLTFAKTALFCSNGAEAVEDAIKLIRYYHYAQGNARRNRIITLEDGFHGLTLGGISAGGDIALKEKLGPLVPGFDRVKKNDIEALKEAINENTAGVLLEPVQSEGGVYVLDVEYLKEVRRLTEEKDILLCFDEVQSGYCRMGTLFYYQSIGVVPDLLTCGKAMGNGFPIAACLTSDLVSNSITSGYFLSSYVGNPLAMTVGNAVLDVMLTSDNFSLSDSCFYSHICDVGGYLKERLLDLAFRFPDIIEAVRGDGLLLGIELKVSAQSVLLECLKNRLIVTRTSNDKVIRFTPPLIVEIAHINIAMATLYDVLKQIKS